jgi:hypothetical protein
MSADTYPTHWRVLTLLAIAELFAMSLWFAASAVTPQLRALSGPATSEAAWLTTIVQLGFVGGTAVLALLNLPDLVPSGSRPGGFSAPPRSWARAPTPPQAIAV